MGGDELVVAGGGIAGLSLAWELARRGQPPLLLSSDAPAASSVAAGILAPMPEAAINPGVARLAVEALRAYPDCLARLAQHSQRETGFTRSGVLRLAYSPAEAEGIREQVGLYEAAGLASAWLSPQACRRRCPGLGVEGLAGGLLCEEESQLQAAWMIEALTEACAGLGVVFQNADLVRVEEAQGAVVLHLAGGAAITAGRVALAMGSWTARLPGLDYLLRPLKGQLLVFENGVGPGTVLFHEMQYLLAKPDGTVVLGGTVEDEGFSLEPTGLVEELRSMLPLAWASLVGAPAHARVGLRPAAPDLLPVVGPLDEMPGVYVFSGHHRNGFMLGPFTAGMAAAELVGEPTAPLLTPLRPRRLRGSRGGDSAAN